MEVAEPSVATDDNTLSVTTIQSGRDLEGTKAFLCSGDSWLDIYPGKRANGAVIKNETNTGFDMYDNDDDAGPSFS